MKSQWIACPGNVQEKNTYFRVRRKFALAEVPASLEIKIAAESYYQAWINGTCVGRGPARGSRTLNYYDSMDIAPLLKPGENILAVLVQSMNIPNFVSFPSGAALWLELGEILASDESWEVQLAPDWKRDVGIFTCQVGFMEWRDHRLTPQGWECGLDKGEWQAALSLGVEIPGKKLLPRPVPALLESPRLPVEISHAALIGPLPDEKTLPPAEALSKAPHLEIDQELMPLCQELLRAGGRPVRIDAQAAGRGVSIVVDFGVEIVGFLELELDAQAGVQIDIAYDEELEGGRIDACRHHYRPVDRHFAREGRQLIGNTIHERGFRMVEIALRDFAAPVTLHRISAIDRRYPFSRRASFNCADPLLNRIWDVCVETLSVCTTDVFNDCPWRERSFWVNDLIVENLCALEAFGDPRMHAHALRLALSNVRPEDGLVPGVCPDDGRAKLVLIPTNLFLPLMLRDLLLHGGDLALAAELLPEMLAVIDRFSPWFDADGLLCPPEKYWNFFDWSFEIKGTNFNGRKTSMLNWLYCGALEAVAWIQEQLGDAEAASKTRTRIAPALKELDNRFWLEKRNCYADALDKDGKLNEDSSQLAQALALLSGHAPEKRKDALVKALHDPSLRVPELYLHFFALQAMRSHGLDMEAIGRIRKYWGDMILSGTPTLWEAAIHAHGKKAFNNAGSLCHGFGSAPIDYFQTAILGIIPTSPGFKTFSVAPGPHDLDFASGRVPTPAGSISMSWRREGESLSVELSVPYGLEARTQTASFGFGKHLFKMPVAKA